MKPRMKSEHRPTIHHNFTVSWYEDGDSVYPHWHRTALTMIDRYTLNLFNKTEKARYQRALKKFEISTERERRQLKLDWS